MSKRDISTNSEPVPSAAFQFNPSQYHALIISVAEYDDSEIKNLVTPVTDGESVASALIDECGFLQSNVRRLVSNNDVSWDGIDVALRSYIKKLTPADSFLIYFAGHGKEDEDTSEGYWLPGNAKFGARWTWFPNHALKDIIGQYKAQHVAVVSDSCYSGRLLRLVGDQASDTSVPYYYDNISRSRSRRVLTSGNDHPVADEGGAGMSVFCLRFTDYLRRGSDQLFTLTNAYLEIRTRISGQQVCYGPLRDIAHDNGEMVFRRTRPLLTLESAPAIEKMPVAKPAPPVKPEIRQKPASADVERKPSIQIPETVVDSRPKKPIRPTKTRLGKIEVPRVEPFILNPSHVSAGDRQVVIANGIEYPFRWCPPGTFLMGRKTGHSDEKPVHDVTLTRGFWMLETQVTQGMYESIVGNNPSRFSGQGKEKHPVEEVSWDNSVAFCKNLRGMLGREVCLPTEAQWEYACRAGATGERYGELDSIAWHGDNSKRKTHAVGLKSPNKFGLYDMIGNVWEWCNDWYSKYDASHLRDPVGPPGGSVRVRRGGSSRGGWGGGPGSCRAAYRSGAGPGDRSGSLGFRVVLPSV